MLFQIHRAKLLLLFSLHPTDQQGFLCCHNFLIVTPSYHSKETPIGLLHAEQIFEAVLPYVLKIAFPASLLQKQEGSITCMILFSFSLIHLNIALKLL